MTIKTTIRTGVTLATIVSATPAYADFYDGAGLPPEKDWQEHFVISAGDGVSVTAITKYIPADGHSVSIFAVGETNGKLNPLGVAQGYRFDMPLDDANYIGLLPMVQASIGGDNITFAPTLYATIIAERWTFDPRVQVPVSYSADLSLDAVVVGATVGFQIADSLRVGPDVEMNIFDVGNSLRAGALSRYDPPHANGDHWMEMGLSATREGNAMAQLQYRVNF